MHRQSIDGGKPFDWGLASQLYARYRDIYPPAFYRAILDLGLCGAGQHVLDLGTGTGVLPRALSAHGAHFVGADISPQQIDEARRLSAEAGLEIAYLVASAEELDLPPASFDTVTACQCYQYFDEAAALPRIRHLLRPGGSFAVLHMNWLPHEDEIVRRSEELVLRHNPAWTGGGFMRAAPAATAAQLEHFTVRHALELGLPVEFTRESWTGRMLACRGVAASLPDDAVRRFRQELSALLEEVAPPAFQVLHSATVLVLEPLRV